MPDWNTRLAVTLTDPTDDSVIDITPIDSFQPQFNLGADALHSLESTHIGAVFAPRDIKFSMTVKAMGPAAGKLTALALKGQRFTISMVKSADSVGDDWSFVSIVLNDCMITSVQPTNAAVTGAPAAVFQGVSLQGTIDSKNGGVNTVGHK